MRKILHYLKDFQRKHFDTRLYLSVVLFLTICFVFNYWLDFEDSVIDSFRGTLYHWLWMFLWHVFPFLGVCLIVRVHGKSKGWLRSKAFWQYLIIGFAVLAFDRANYLLMLIPSDMNAIDHYFINRCLSWSGSLIMIVIPITLIYLILEKEHPRNYYGLVFQRFNPKPYFILLGIAAVFIGIGSFLSEIQNYYPRFQFSYGDRFAERHELPVWVSVIIYEMSYASDFVSVELFFRGFLIHAFVKMLGGYAVLPMIATYAFLHFGKPLSEAISSVFGGYILGVVSYYSKNVWGGIIIHMGVAWVMELFGYLQSLM